MTSVAIKVMAMVNAPYGADLSAHQLAEKLVDPASVAACDATVFSFLSEVKPALQTAFIEAMGVDKKAASKVAAQYAAKSGYPLTLAA